MISKGTTHNDGARLAAYMTTGNYTGNAGTLLTSASSMNSQTYAYAVTSFWPYQITSVTDGNGNKEVSWTYSYIGQAMSSVQGNSGLGANYTSFSYGSPYSQVTNANGVTDTYAFALYQGTPQVTSITRAATTGAGATAAASESFGYDGNGFQNSITDWNSNVTNITNNSTGNPTSITEAYGTSAARTTTIAYDSTWVRLPDTITTTGKTTGFTYDGSGNVSTRTETDTTSGSTPYSTSGTTRTWTFGWGTGANIGLLTSVTGPRTDLTQTVSFGYPASGSNTGVLTSVTDPLSHTTTVNTSTGGGLPTQITDPDGVVTTLAYDARLNLNTSTLSTTAGNLVTTYTHDAANNLTQVTLPDLTYPAYSYAFTYDSANRPTTVTNALGETINATLDALGNVTAMNIKDASSTTRFSRTASFDNLGRKLSDVDAYSNTTTYAYDPNSNVTGITDPRSNATALAYDALNRLYQVTDRLSHTTTAAYDAHDAVTSVTDPNSNTTTYTRDGFERAKQLVSPDSGTSVYHYDLANNMTQRTDGASVVMNRTFDAANRELTRTFPGNTAENIAKTYDQTGAWGFGIGRLTTMTDAGGTLYVAYDERGNDTIQSRVLSLGPTLNIEKYYDAASRIYAVTEPHGWTTGWPRDAAGQVSWIGYTAPGSSTIQGIAGGLGATPITHMPFGPAATIPYDNGVTRTNTYDLNYRLTNTTDTGSSTVLNQSYAYDANSNVTGITDSVNAANSQTMTYDNMDRLLTAASGTGGYGSYAWTWDANGNRASESLNGATPDSYSYTSGTNQLASTSGSGYGFSYNDAGATTKFYVSGTLLTSQAWNQSEQFASGAYGSSPPAITNTYDGFGQRVLKSTTIATAFFYQNRGNLLEETNTINQNTDYVTLDPSSPRDAFYPVGMLSFPDTGTTGAAAYFVHADRLGTPQTVTDSSQAAQWSTTYLPFGAVAGTITNPNNITQNLRLPGQYNDPEFGTYHNGFREYVPFLGRYMQSDPIGLAAGTNTYQYAKGNPFKNIDPKGLDVYVGEHGAFFPGDPFQHLVIVLRPNDPAAFANNPLFQTGAGMQATLGAQAFGPGDGLFGTLVGEANYPGDSPNNLTKLTLVPRPKCTTDTTFINTLISAFQTYGNNLTYNPFPEFSSATYNSNSFVSGLLTFSGTTRPDLPGVTPGYEIPVPLHIFPH